MRTERDGPGRWHCAACVLITSALICTAWTCAVPRAARAADLCEGVKCRVVYEGEERRNAPARVVATCASVAPCICKVTLYAGWTCVNVLTYLIPKNSSMTFDGIYPPNLRVYVGRGRLPWKMEAEGLRAWEAYQTVAVGGTWPVHRRLRPTSVEVMP